MKWNLHLQQSSTISISSFNKANGAMETDLEQILYLSQLNWIQMD